MLQSDRTRCQGDRPLLSYSGSGSSSRDLQKCRCREPPGALKPGVSDLICDVSGASNSVRPKALDAVNEALLEAKPCPALKEANPTSLLFPNDSAAWSKVDSTFSIGRLPADCASTQFNEELPNLPESLIKAEFDARSRLSRTLYTLLLTVAMRQESLGVDNYIILAKSQIGTVTRDMFDFRMARRACWKHVLAQANVRHELTKLLNSCTWGGDLIPRPDSSGDGRGRSACRTISSHALGYSC